MVKTPQFKTVIRAPSHFDTTFFGYLFCGTSAEIRQQAFDQIKTNELSLGKSLASSLL
jgi:hypothetical protein